MLELVELEAEKEAEKKENKKKEEKKEEQGEDVRRVALATLKEKTSGEWGQKIRALYLYYISGFSFRNLEC